MIGKVNTACKTLTERTRKDNSDTSAKQKVQKPSNKKPKPSSPNDVLVVDNCGTTIEVTVKTKGRKGSSAMVNSNLSAPKIMEEKMSTGITESHTNNWGRTFREQSRPALRKGLQQLAGQIQSSKHARPAKSERKEIQTIMDTHQSHKYICQNSRILDEIPVKQAAKKSLEQTKAISNSTAPSTTTITSSLESIEVTDRGVQCGGIFDCSNDRLGIYNPVRMLGILMQEMEGLVKDERSSKILTEMEQALLRIPKEPGKLPPDVLEKVALCTKLEAGMTQLESTSKELELASARLRKDKQSLQEQVSKQAILLEEGQQRERDAEIMIKKLKMDLNEGFKSAAESRRIISILREENKRIEASNKLAKDLRRDLNEQIELAEQRYMEGQYLKLERDKLVALSSYKDGMLVELRKKLTELQNHISEQLVNIHEAGNQQMSIFHGGVACSSPTSTSSKNSFGPQFCPELSEISLSVVDGCFSNSVRRMDLNGFSDNAETKRFTDKTQSEFVSLPGEETSHTISLTHRKEEESKLPVSANNKNNEPTTSSEWKLDGFHSAPNLGCRDAGDSMNLVESENKEHRPRFKTRKFSSTTDTKQLYDETRRLSNHEDDRNSGVERCSGDPVSVKDQFEIMFQDMRRQSKFLVHVQSPPRIYPHSDWSDSSFPTISVISESNIA